MFNTKTTQMFRGSRNTRWIVIYLGLILSTLLGIAAANFIPEQIDWVRTYRPAARELLALRSPYDISTFYNPPWILIPLLPIALLPDKVGNGFLFVISLWALIYSAIKMGAKPLSLIAFLLSFPVVFLLLFGQIDWMILIGLTLPPQIGLIFIFTKPQIAIPYAVFILIQTWRNKGFLHVVKIFFPISMMVLLSLLIFGLWFKDSDLFMLSAIYNYSLWPGGIVFGLLLLGYAIIKDKQEVSISAGPFFSPYVGVHSWTFALIALLPYQWMIGLTAAGSWFMYFIQLPK